MLKQWLENNKIYFEIFSYLIIGMTGVIVSLSQSRIANKEWDLHKKESLPFIRIDSRLERNDSTTFFDSEHLEISNEGNSLKKFGVVAHTFYEINYTCGRCPGHKMIYIPINDYYSMQVLTNNPKGKLVDMCTVGNNKYLYDFSNRLRQMSQRTSFYMLNKITIVNVTYSDIDGEVHSEYYKENIGGGLEITEQVYNTYIAKSDSLFKGVSYSMSGMDFQEVQGILNTVTYNNN